MPSSSETSPHMFPAEDFNVSIYVPVHYEFSQIEYVAPFLQQYRGSKVFIYKWNGIRDKITDYYLRSPEYAAADLSVYDFSLKYLLKAILDEPVGRKVVFLLTTSMAYSFGTYQRDLLLAVKSTLDALADTEYKAGVATGDAARIARAEEIKNKVWGVSVIGHCLYGCNSCKGNDHKVPVYYTRYFKGNIPYTVDSVKAQFQLQDKPIPVLCAPSTGETTLLQHRNLLEYLKKLQDEGTYKFVWKFHPAVYNPLGYDESVECDRIEKANVEWIFQHFDVTREDEPCLLPFVEAFPIIFCDLHSSVPFIASYFSPKAIVCYWNDADYEVPAGRDQAFLSNLHVYQELDGLEHILAADKVPKAMGDRSFFWSQYGHVDGNEVGRFASLCGWPRHAKSETVVADGKTSVDLAPLFRPALAATVRAWDKILEGAQELKRTKPDPDEDPECEVKLAMGLFKDTQLHPPSSVANGTTAALSLTTDTADPARTVKVMSFNLWWGSEGCYRTGYLAGETLDRAAPYPDHETRQELLDKTARVILNSGVDVVGCQECASIARDDKNHEDEIDRGELGSRVNNLADLAARLTALSSAGDKWVAVDQGILTPGKGCRNPWGILTRVPVVAKSPKGFGVQLAATATRPAFWVFNTHLPYKPYQPYQVQRPHMIPYEGAPALTNEQDVIESSTACRGAQIDTLLADIAAAVGNATTDPVFLVGDLNEPSHLDWTNDAAIAGDHPLPVAWPSTARFAAAGFVDAFRTMRADPVRDPGFTWCCYNEDLANGRGDEEGWRVHGDGARDHPDRIDFVLAQRARVVDVQVIGNGTSCGTGRQVVGLVDVAVPNREWTSDHRAVVGVFEL
ncbi:hypothetical protein GGF32_009487 [Allomyces javanicus]|nr:hypothetical protein GGF32_009487 [Allomyces javanicus]